MAAETTAGDDAAEVSEAEMTADRAESPAPAAGGEPPEPSESSAAAGSGAAETAEAAETAGAAETAETAEPVGAGAPQAPEGPAAAAEPEGRTDRRKVREGLVVSDKMEATVVVAVVERVRHPRYRKTVQRTKKLYVHDAENSARVGDRVRVIETRPLSKLKHWRLAEILERAR